MELLWLSIRIHETREYVVFFNKNQLAFSSFQLLLIGINHPQISLKTFNSTSVPYSKQIWRKKCEYKEQTFKTPTFHLLTKSWSWYSWILLRINFDSIVSTETHRMVLKKKKKISRNQKRIHKKWNLSDFPTVFVVLSVNNYSSCSIETQSETIVSEKGK